MVSIEFALDVIPPWRLDLTAWTLRRRQKNMIEQWDGGRYNRPIVVGNRPVKMTITQVGTVENSQLQAVLQSQEILSSTPQSCLSNVS